MAKFFTIRLRLNLSSIKAGDSMGTYTDAQKALMNHDDTMKNVVISFPGTSIPDIENDKIYLESLSFEESLLDQSEIKLGKCNSGLLTVKVADFSTNIDGKTMNVAIELTNDTLNTSMTYQLGKFIVKTSERTADRRWRVITAVDFMSKFDVDITDWYNNVLYATGVTTRTVNDILSMLCTKIGVSYDTNHTLPNSTLAIKKSISPTTLSGLDFLEKLLEINGRLGHFNENGVLCFHKLEIAQTPESITTYKSCDYEDYSTLPVTGVLIYLDTDVMGGEYLTSGTGVVANEYSIKNNYFAFGLDNDYLSTLAKSIYDEMPRFTYRPSEVTTKGAMYLELGKSYSLSTNNETITSMIFKRRIEGIQALFSTVGSEGQSTPLSADNGDGIYSEVSILRDKSARIEKNLDGLTVEFNNYAEGTSAAIEVNAEAISAEVTRATNAETALNSSIIQTADKIRTEVSSTYDGNNLIRNSNTYDFDDYYFSGNLLANHKNLKLSNGNKLDVKIGGY